MKILYITPDGFDTPNPNNQMAETMISDFLDNGYSVHLIQSHKKGINPDIPESLLSRNGFTVDTVKRKVIDKTKFTTRYFNDMKYAFTCVKYWRRVKDADVIYLQSYPTVVFPMLLLKLLKRKVPIIYSIYDVFPGHAHDIGVVRSKFIYNCMRVVQKLCYRMPAAITILSEDMKKSVVKEGADADRVYVVPAWFDTKTTREVPKEENRFIQKYNISPDKFYVQFAGTIGYVFNYETVIKLAQKLSDNDNIVIQIIGDGNVKKDFVSKAEMEGIRNITFYPLQPVELVPDVYSACNLCIIPLKKGVIRAGVPSKAPILMACKRVIVNSVEGNSEYAKMFVDNKIGVAVDIDDIDGLAKAIINLYNSPELVKELAENAYEFGKKRYSSDENTRKLMDIFDILGEKK